jgi:hypothetical protein
MLKSLLILSLFSLLSLHSATDKVYYTGKGKKYHSSQYCRTIVNSKTIVSVPLQEAQTKGLKKCKACF